MKSSSYGKGDSYRPVNLKQYDENYDRIFAPRKTIAEWQKYFGDVIVDFSGFKEYNADDLITKEDYLNRVDQLPEYVPSSRSR
jgi:hypothetical protein